MFANRSEEEVTILQEHIWLYSCYILTILKSKNNVMLRFRYLLFKLLNRLNLRWYILHIYVLVLCRFSTLNQSEYHPFTLMFWSLIELRTQLKWWKHNTNCFLTVCSRKHKPVSGEKVSVCGQWNNCCGTVKGCPRWKGIPPPRSSEPHFSFCLAFRTTVFSLKRGL